MATGSNYSDIWIEVLGQIRAEISESDYASWFNLDFVGAEGGVFTVAAASAFYADQVAKRWKTLIEEKLADAAGKKFSLKVIARPKAPEKEGEKPVKTPATASGEGGAEAETAAKTADAAKKPPKKREPHPQLVLEYTFDSYVIGKDNSFAANAALAVAKNPGQSYNPLLLYGGSGLGKTHLMLAIGNYIHENSDMRVTYITGNDFTEEFVRAVREGSPASFKNKYRYKTDILLLDDVHYIGGKTETMEELYLTFDALTNAKKQIVFTCDRPVSELKNFTERLRTRVGKGTNIDLQPPSYETRCAILQKKAELFGVDIPAEVINLISKNISTNVRDLESALKTLAAYAQLTGKSVTLEIAQERLRDQFAAPMQMNVTIETIQKVIADEYHLGVNDLKGKKRSKNIVYPRQLAMYIIREITEYTTTDIGQSFGGRDHTTVMHSCNQIAEKIKTEPAMESVIQSLIRKVKDYSTKF